MDDRTQRALDQWSEMTVEPVKGHPGVFAVSNVQGKEYTVDLNENTCTCPDYVNRQKSCKHIYRVVLDGYEPAPQPVRSSAVNWKPEGSGFSWFDIRLAGAGAECLFCRGAKKDWKFWIAVPGSGPTSGMFTLYWGAFDEDELQRKTACGEMVGCQRKEKGSRAPYHEVVRRAEGKKAKGYHNDERLRKMLFKNLRLDSNPSPAAEPEPQPETTEEKEKPNWKPDNPDFVWFNNLSVSAQTLRNDCLCLVAPGARKEYKYWIVFWEHQSGRICLFWGDFSPPELLTGPLKGQSKEVQGFRNPYLEARRRFRKKLNEGYDYPNKAVRTSLLNALVARCAVDATSETEKPEEEPPKKPNTSWKPEKPDFVWFNNLSLSAQNLWQSCFCLVAPGEKKLSKYWIVFWEHRSGRICLFWGEYDSLAELYTRPLKGQCEELQGFSNPYKEARDRFLQKSNEDENYDAPLWDERHALFKALIARYAEGDTLDIKKSQKTKKKPNTNWKPESTNFVWF